MRGLLGGALLVACGGGDGGGSSSSGAGGSVSPSRAGGSGGGAASAGSGGGSASASGGAGGGASGGAPGSGGESAASGGVAGTADAAGPTGGDDAAATDAAAPPASGDAAPPATGGLGPGSADDSPPLVLPGSKLIFNGKTLTGWKCDAKWSVKDGTIDGTGTGNSFCSTADNHESFRLTGKSRVVKDPNNHAGICFWGPPGKCLQITPVSGSLWDYRGGGNARLLPRTRDYMKWNFFELLVDAKTGNIDMAVEGQAFPTYTDKKGHPANPIGLQLHAKPNEVQYKDLALEDNPTMMKLLTAAPAK